MELHEKISMEDIDKIEKKFNENILILLSMQYVMVTIIE